MIKGFFDIYYLKYYIMADQVEKAIKTLKLDSLDSNESLVFVKEKTGFRPSQVAFGLLALNAVILILFQASTLIVALGCFLVPAYLSFRSLEKDDLEQNVKYLTYWVIFTGTELISFILDWIFGSLVVAFLRVAFTAALLHPKVELSSKLYHGVVEPFIKTHEKTIDEKAQELLEKGKDKIEDLTDAAKEKLQ